MPPPRYTFPESYQVTSVDVSIITPMHSHEKVQEAVVKDLGDLWPDADITLKLVEDSCHDSRWSVLCVARSSAGIRWAKDLLASAPKNVKSYDQYISRFSSKLCKELYEEVSLAGHVDEHLQDQVVCFQALCNGLSSLPRGSDHPAESLSLTGLLIDAMGNLDIGNGKMRREKACEPFGHGSMHTKTVRWVVGELLPKTKFYNKGDFVEGVGFSL